MTTQLTYIIAQERIADLQRHANRERLAQEADMSHHRSRKQTRIIRLASRLIAARA